MGIFDVTAQEAYPRLNNSSTGGEPFCRLNPVWKLLFSCQRARGNSYHPVLLLLPLPSQESGAGNSVPTEKHKKLQVEIPRAPTVLCAQWKKTDLLLSCWWPPVSLSPCRPRDWESSTIVLKNYQVEVTIVLSTWAGYRQGGTQKGMRTM